MANPFLQQSTMSGRFATWKRLILILVVLVLIGLGWFAYKTVYVPSDTVTPVGMLPPVKDSAPIPEKTEKKTTQSVPKSISKPLNLNIAPLDNSREVGPIPIDDLVDSAAEQAKDDLSKSQVSPLELKYGYKGRDEKGLHLELGASEKSSQVKLGVQIEENKVNVNSIEVEIPLSK